MHHRPLVIRPHARPGHVALGPGDAAQLHRARATSSTRAAWCALAEYSRDCLKRAARARPASRYDERTQGTLQLFRTQKQLDGTAADIAILQALRRRLTRCSTATAASRHEPALARVQRQVRRRRCCLPGDETGDCFKFTAAPGRAGRGAGVRVPLRRRRSSGIAPRRQADRPASTPTPARCTADAYLVALGSYSPLLLRAARHPHAGLSGQGLLDHRADHRRRAARPNRR